MTRFFLILSLFLSSFAMAQTAQAQEQYVAAYASAGSGLSIGAGNGTSHMRRTPVFLDLGARTWTSDRSYFVYGGSLRLEVDGRVGVGVVGKIAYARTFGPLTILAGGGLPFFFAPYSLLGIEGSVELHFTLFEFLGLFASGLFDVYFAGSDRPTNSALIMINGVFGVELLF